MSVQWDLTKQKVLFNKPLPAPTPDLTCIATIIEARANVEEQGAASKDLQRGAAQGGHNEKIL